MIAEMRTVKSLFILSICGLLFSSHGFGEELTVEKSSSSGHGYLFVRLERSRIQDPAIIRDEPGSASDTFEIIAGAINYVGDWEMNIRSGNVEQRSLTGAPADVTMVRRWSVDTRQNSETLQKLFEVFPDYANRFGIYLSMMGKKAISLKEFLKIVEQNAE